MNEESHGILSKPLFQVFLYGATLALVMFIIIYTNSKDSESTPTPTFTPGEQIAPGQNNLPVTPEPTLSPEITSSPTPEPETQLEPEREYEEHDDDHHTVESDLSPEDGEEASDIIFEGIENYFAVGSLESITERDQRLSQYFPDNSRFRDPDDKNALILYSSSQSSDEIVEQSGIIQWMNVKKATYAEGFISIIGLNVQAMIDTQIMQSYMVLEVTAQELDDRWVITEIIEVNP